MKNFKKILASFLIPTLILTAQTKKSLDTYINSKEEKLIFSDYEFGFPINALPEGHKLKKGAHLSYINSHWNTICETWLNQGYFIQESNQNPNILEIRDLEKDIIHSKIQIIQENNQISEIYFLPIRRKEDGSPSPILCMAKTENNQITTYQIHSNLLPELNINNINSENARNVKEVNDFKAYQELKAFGNAVLQSKDF